jgi:hypothetical protein
MTDESFGDVPDLVTFPTGPPLALLEVAAACLVISLVLLLPQGPVAGLVGYVLASLVAVTCVALFRYLDGKRRSSAAYRINSLASRASAGLLAACWLTACAHAWQLATAWSR